jgi:hypothetical protein
MNKPVVALSISTALLASSTAYLAFELHRRDTTLALAAATPVAAAAEPRSSSASSRGADIGAIREGASARTSMTPTASVTATARDATTATARSRDAQTELAAGFARQMVARYDDPNQRPAMLEEQRSTIRRQYEKLKERLKLSDSEFAQLVTVMAEDQLLAQMNWARCAADPACDLRKLANQHVDRTLEYQAMLGSEGAEAFTEFSKSIGERDAVSQLRGRLSDNSLLPESQAEKLIAALAEERERFTKEAESRGANAKGWGTNLGVLWYTDDSGVPDQYIAEATQYSQRLRARAASVLTPAQLAAYVQMQEELLAVFTANVRPPPRQQKSTLAQTS